MSGQYVYAVHGVMINKNQCNYNYIVIIVIPAKMQANVALDSRFHRKRPIEHLSYNGKPVISGLQNALNGKWVTECTCNDCIANGWQWRARLEIQRDRSACKLPYETNACCNRGRFHFLTNKRLMLRFNFTSAACWWYISHWSFEIQKTLLLFFVLVPPSFWLAYRMATWSFQPMSLTVVQMTFQRSTLGWCALVH